VRDGKFHIDEVSLSQLTDICIDSRRSKTKCNGERPVCRGCSRRHVTCTWLQAAAPNSFYALTPPQEQELPKRNKLERRPQSHPTIPNIPSQANTSFNLPESRKLQRLIQIFFNRHHEAEFCSFFHKPSLDIPTLHRRSPFLVASILSLSALYISADEAEADFGFQTPSALSEYYARLAKFHANGLYDEPSSKCALFYS
jgi:hypothetical protein